jgi:hypothetical protein
MEEGYNETLDPGEQINTEEQIASLIFRASEGSLEKGLDEDTCAQLGRDILLLVLQQFRPDFF